MFNQPGSSALAPFSRRRPVRGRRRGRGQALPDWVWGLLLGGFALAVAAVVFVVSQGGIDLGGGGSACDKPLSPLETSNLSAAGFSQEDAGLARVVQAADAGDLAAAESAFFGPVHNFTHNADPAIRERDPELAKQLCHAVLKIEDDLAFDADSFTVSRDAQRIRELLQEGARALGY